ncbi:hypothetical protein G6030_00850 [Dietzia sp. E1]|nr:MULTISPECIES: hypothetical protein [Dietzia]MBB1015062.1 hypothetical protein [Dietzia kunjamensis subsp. schimae]MBB1019867.1 hypothetical protein [Dietzia sp. E1]
MLRLVATAATATMVIAAPTLVAGAQPATTARSEAPATTSPPVPTAPSTNPSPSSPAAGPPSQDTPPEQRRDQATPSPRFHTTACAAFWNPNFGRNFTVCGRILDKYHQLGGPGGFLGPPTSDELTNADGIGKRTSFQGDATIYWHPDTDAHPVGGAIGSKWAQFGYDPGPLGYPITDEITNPDGIGKRQAFQHDSSIYWHPNTGAHQIGGQIGARWGELEWEASYLGYPTTDELSTPNGAARFNHFENGSVYWAQPTGGHDLTREMMAIWGAYGFETGLMGLPAGNNIPDSDISVLARGQQAAPRLRIPGEPQEQVFQNAIGRFGTDGEAYVRGR